MDSDTELNMSWEDEFIRSTDCEITYSPEPMDKIRIQLIYVNTENQIHHSVIQSHSLTIISDLSGSEFSETAIMRIIMSNRNFQNKRYKCESISHYCLSIEPTKLFDNQHVCIDHKPYFKTIDLPRTIHIPPSLFIFHSINSIWFLFRELELIKTPIQPIVSIIKNPSNTQPKKTKRVRISSEPPITIFGKTRKRF